MSSKMETTGLFEDLQGSLGMDRENSDPVAMGGAAEPFQGCWAFARLPYTIELIKEYSQLF